jgi:DoxX-like protein
MPSAALVNQSTRTASWTGRVLSTVAVAFMAFDGVIHVLEPAPVVQAFARLGFPLSASVGIGILELVFTALYAIPRTAALGAVLLSAYLGGAVATQLRAGSGWFEMIFPVIIGAIVWGGLALRDARVRAFIRA